VSRHAGTHAEADARTAVHGAAAPSAPHAGHGDHPSGSSHGHSHGPLPAASRHTRRIVTAVLIPAAVATLLAMIIMWPGSIRHAASLPDSHGGVRATGTVASVTEHGCPPETPGTEQPQGWVRRCGSAVVRVTEGPGAGTDATVDLPQGPSAAQLHVDDDVVLLYFPDAVAGGRAYAVTDHDRSTPMIWLLVLAAGVILVFGRWRGITSLIGLGVSFAILLLFVIPAIAKGSPPLLAAVVGASAIMFAALYLTHGVNVHTSVAVAGTLVSLVLTGVLGFGFTALMHLTGIASDDDSFLATTQATIDMRGLLLAGIVIGALGVLDDVTVTQAATVAEMAAAAPTTRLRLYQAATRVGRAHVASAVNTIVLAYAGASLPLLLVISTGSQPISDLLTSEFLAQEILRSAVGTIGLVASVPITTALAALVADLRSAPAATA
jgi:uncharacterized membrane protein